MKPKRNLIIRPQSLPEGILLQIGRACPVIHVILPQGTWSSRRAGLGPIQGTLKSHLGLLSRLFYLWTQLVPTSPSRVLGFFSLFSFPSYILPCSLTTPHPNPFQPLISSPESSPSSSLLLPPSKLLLLLPPPGSAAAVPQAAGRGAPCRASPLRRALPVRSGGRKRPPVDSEAREPCAQVGVRAGSVSVSGSRPLPTAAGTGATPG